MEFMLGVGVAIVIIATAYAALTELKTLKRIEKKLDELLSRNKE